MLSLGGITFLTPWALAALIALPAIWWLLRLMPPAPRHVAFPAVRLLRDLGAREEEPARTPPWLLAFRLLIAALIILALAGPLLGAKPVAFGRGALLLVVDDGFAAAPRWALRQEALDRLLDRAARSDQPVMLLGTAPPSSGAAIRPSGLLAANAARSLVQAWQPLPWATARIDALTALAASHPPAFGAVVWLSDGIDNRGNAAAFATGLERLGRLHVVVEPEAERAEALLPPELDRSGLHLTLLRADAAAPEQRFLQAEAPGGQILARVAAHFAAGEDRTTATIDLPTALANRLDEIAITGEASAGATVLLDGRFRRRPVGLVSGDDATRDQPLLSGLYYLNRALQPYAAVSEGSITDLLARPLSVLILDDVGQMTGPEQAALARWLDQGGVLIRFAGPRLAAHADSLLPVPLRPGDRSLGGALTWEQPAHLAPFAATSPFQGLTPAADVTVRRQVLAEPAPDLGARTWATLTDGTPLVTAARRGKGWLVLFHTTANARWSNLALSGLYVEMLRRLVDLGHGVAGSGPEQGLLAPDRLLDGFGRLGPAGGAARAVTPAEIDHLAAGPEHPPGFYGSEAGRRALNLTAGMTGLRALGPLRGVSETATLGERQMIDLRPPLLALALGLMLLDFLLALWLRGLLRFGRQAALGLVLALGGGLGFGLVLAATSRPALAQTGAGASHDDSFAIAASTQFRLAYVRTGDRPVDDISRAGLTGLTAVLNERTEARTGAPLGLDIEHDPLVFFPLIYWPMTPDQPDLSAAALAKIDTYMTHGGTILFDTRDAGDIGMDAGGVGPGTQTLRRLLDRLDTPPLIELPADHVLTRAFYLLHDFPGRVDGGPIWVERESKGYDGVSGLIIGGNDWAGAWAVDDQGRPLLPVVPGGERQREMAYRFGINLVMYCLTGNYKSDQVHVPAILERLGQ